MKCYKPDYGDNNSQIINLLFASARKLYKITSMKCYKPDYGRYLLYLKLDSHE